MQQRLRRASDLLVGGGRSGGGGRTGGVSGMRPILADRPGPKTGRGSPRCAPSPASRRSPALVGEELGTTDWLTIDQERVDAFADATDDHQWIHVDAERAAAGPFGGTIAHGYLTLSLLPLFGTQVLAPRDARRQAQLRAQQGPLPRARPRRLPHPRPRHARRRDRRTSRQAGHLRLDHRDRGRAEARLRRRDRRAAAAAELTVGLPERGELRSAAMFDERPRLDRREISTALSPPGRAAPASARTTRRRRRRTRPRARPGRGRSARARRSAA